MSVELVDQIRFGWLVLSEAGAPDAGEVRTHPLGGPWLLGLGSGGTPCLLAGVTEPGPEEREGAVTIVSRELDTDEGNRAFVVIGCSEPSLRDVFDHFVAGVVEDQAKSPGRHPAATALVVLARWRALFRVAGNALGPVDLAALLAELLVLVEIIERDPQHSVAVWAGPGGARHDLRRGSTAIEVKATLSHTARQAGINGIDQLEAPAEGSLTLAWHRLERVEEGSLSVFGLADRIIAAGAPPEQLFGLLEQAGSPPSLREAHDAVRFELRDRAFFAVGDGFPRVTAESFAAGPPEGVDDLRYVIALPPPEARLSPTELEQLFERMAGVA